MTVKNNALKKVLKSLLLLVVLLYSFAASAYSNMTTQQLINKRSELTSLKNSYRSQGNAAYALANIYASSMSTMALSNMYRAQGEKYYNMAIDAAAQLEKIEAELQRRNYGGGSGGSGSSSTVSSLTLTPSSTTYIGYGITFTCKAKFSNGTTKTVTPVNWDLSDKNYAYLFDSNGKKYFFVRDYTPTGKTITVTAFYGYKKAQAHIYIKYAKVVLKSIAISSSFTQLKVDSNTTLTCIARYNNGSNHVITPTWSVSNSKYASISGGKIKAKSAGIGKTITVTASYSGKKATKTFTIVKQPTLTSLTISPSTSKITSGSSVALTCKANYGDGTSKTVTPSWSVSNSKYASISSGKLKAKSAGVGKSVTVTATYSGKKTTKTFTIAKPVTLSSISISASTTKLKVNSSVALTCKAKYSDGTTKTVTPSWSVSKSKYASISSGKIKAKSAGGGQTVTVTASFNGKKATKKFTIAKPVTLKSISISASTTKLKVDSSVALTCKAKYSDGTTKTVTPSWSVSKSKYASISSGKIKAKSAGGGQTVTVTASFNGKKATKKFTIAKPVTLKSISISLSKSKISAGGSSKVTCKAKYSDGTTKTVTPTLRVSDSKYASISSGKVIAKSAGKGKSVTVYAYYGNQKTSKKISISK